MAGSRRGCKLGVQGAAERAERLGPHSGAWVLRALGWALLAPGHSPALDQPQVPESSFQYGWAHFPHSQPEGLPCLPASGPC